MLLKVSNIKWLGNHRLRVRFTDASSGEHDFANMVAETGDLMEPLRDPGYFARVFLEYGAPTWPNGFDIAPVWLQREMEAAGELDTSPVSTKSSSTAARTYHVSPNKEGGWAVRRAGNSRSSRVFETQSEAIGWARDFARSSHSELVIYGKDGRIRDRMTFGSDPFSPKAKSKSSSGARQKRA